MAERVPFASELSPIMERVACEVTRHVGQLELRPVLDENFPAETGGCQVQTTLYGGYHSRITLTSNYLFFFNLAKNMMEESPTLEDVADYAVEYFNVLCGHIVAEIFRVTGVTAKFCGPIFGHKVRSEAVPFQTCTQFCCPYGWLELGYAPLPMTAISAKHEGEEKEL